MYIITVNDVGFTEVIFTSLKLFPTDAALSLVSDLQLLTFAFPS
jgi:hypothetical protein